MKESNLPHFNRSISSYCFIVLLLYFVNGIAHADGTCQDSRADIYNFWNKLTNDCNPSLQVSWQQTGRFKGNWYANTLASGVIKASGSSTTGTTKHAPMAVRHGSKTYFVVNGASEYYPISQDPVTQSSMNDNLAVMVASYDYLTEKVSRPITVHVKGTGDGHDNAVINIDGSGYIYVFISGRSQGRGGLIYKSNSTIESGNAMTNGFSLAYSGKYLSSTFCEPICDRAKDKWVGFTYPQVWWMPAQQKFLMVHTRYVGIFNSLGNSDWYPNDPNIMRAIYTSWVNPNGENGLEVSAPRPLVAIKNAYSKGHYVISKEHNGTVGIAFNVHAKDASEFSPVDNRTNLYFMYTKDGEKWYNGQKTEILSAGEGLTAAEDLSKVVVLDYHNQVTGQTAESGTWCTSDIGVGKVCRRIYLKDLDFVTDGNGDVSRAEILFTGNKDRVYAAIPSADINPEFIYSARASLNNNVWQQERVTNRFGLLNSWPKIDHNYSSGTVKIVGNSVYFAVPVASAQDGYAGGTKTAILKSPSGAIGDWDNNIVYKDGYGDSDVDNNIRSVQGASGTNSMQLIWGHGSKNIKGITKVFIGDWLQHKASLPLTDIPFSGASLSLSLQIFENSYILGSASEGQWIYYSINVPANTTSLTIKLSDVIGSSADADLYVGFNQVPSPNYFECRPYYGAAAAETCTFTNPAAGIWHIAVNAFNAYDSAKLTTIVTE